MFSVVLANPCPPGQPVPAGTDCATPLYGFTDIFGRILGILIPLGGIALFVMLIIGGFYFITSSGVPQKVEGAKATITYAIAGIVLLAAAFLIVQVIANFVGVPAILDFSVYFGG